MCLTSGLTLPCNINSIGGNEDTLYLIPCDWLDNPAFTVLGNGELSAIAINLIASGGVTGFYQFGVKRDSLGYRGEFAGEAPNLYLEQTVTLTVPKMDQTSRNAIQQLLKCNCGLLAIVVDNNCKQWTLGVSYNEDCSKFVCRGLQVAAATSEQTGADPTADPNEYTVTLTGIAFELAREYSGVIPLA